MKPAALPPPAARSSLLVLVSFLAHSTTPSYALRFGFPATTPRPQGRSTDIRAAAPLSGTTGPNKGAEAIRRTRRRRPQPLPLAASKSPPPEILNSQDSKVRWNLERLRQVTALREMSTVKAITSSALRGKLRLSGKDKKGRIFLPGSRSEASFGVLNRLLKETFPIGDFPVALYVKKGVENGSEKIMLTSDGELRNALDFAHHHGFDLNVFLDLHPDYKEAEPPEWLVDVPDPALAEEWEMLSFYRFVEIDQPEAYAKMLQRSWEPLGVRGRIYVASEGVNAQMAVPSTSSDRFERAVESVDKLAGVYLNKAERRWSAEEFNNDPPFPALRVRARKQIVADGLSKPLEWSDGSGKVGKGLSPEEWHSMLDEEGATVIDCRNSYESEVGTFENAVPLDTSFFRESWGELERLVGNADRNAPIMTYCTGGIRCVKVAAYLEQEMGFKNVTRLEGGIVSYSKFAKERALESKFKGVNYVFDKRMGDKVTGDMLSKCHQCGTPCADHTNCANSCCHARFIQCASCAAEYNACCSRGCMDQESRPDLKESLILAEREAMGWGGAISASMASLSGLGAGEGVGAGERERRELMWLVWPFQDPTLNSLFDRAFAEFAEAKSTQQDEAAADALDSSRMIGIVSRLGGVKRALAVGLGAGGTAGRNALRRLAEALGDGGELVAAEVSPEASAAARGLSLVSGARGCSITVIQCEESEIVDRLSAGPVSPPAAPSGAQPASIAPPPEGIFDVILLGGGGDGADVSVGPETATQLMSVGTERDDEGEGTCCDTARRSPAERLHTVLDKYGDIAGRMFNAIEMALTANRRLIKKKGLVMCDPTTLVGGEKAARRLAAEAVSRRSVVEHARVPGAGPSGGLHVFKWKNYSH